MHAPAHARRKNHATPPRRQPATLPPCHAVTPSHHHASPSGTPCHIATPPPCQPGHSTRHTPRATSMQSPIFHPTKLPATSPPVPTPVHVHVPIPAHVHVLVAEHVHVPVPVQVETTPRGKIFSRPLFLYDCFIFFRGMWNRKYITAV